MKTFLWVDRYIQIGVLCVFGIALLLGSMVDEFVPPLLNMIVMFPFWNVTSFLIRLFLPYPKTVFYKFYGCYLILFLLVGIVNSNIYENPLLAIYALLSIPFGIIFISNCFREYNDLEIESEE